MSLSAMAGYEYDLRRLFRPPIDHLPPAEQLQHYRQRDLLPSHLHRVGTGIFGNAPLRQRVIDASLYSPSLRTPHINVVRRSLDGRSPVTNGRQRNESSSIKEPSVYIHRSLSDPAGISALGFTEADYRQWLARRREMRSSLEGLGANKQWLCSKERTPLENTLLSQLRSRERASIIPEDKEESPVSSHSKSPSPLRPKQPRMRQRRQLLREIVLLEHHLGHHRQRLVTLLMTADKNRDRHISVEDLIGIMHKLKVPVSQETLQVFLSALKGDERGRIDYRMVLNGGLARMVEDYFKRLTGCGITAAEDESVSSSQTSSSTAQSCDTPQATTSLQKYAAPSTMDGENGKLVDGCKQEALRQFEALMAHCKANGIVLNWDVAEKALLLPPDHPKQECQDGLRQPGLALLSSQLADPPVTEEETNNCKNLREEFGGAYKELRVGGKSKYVRLSTGLARVKAKTNCWMTFEEFQRLTEHIRSRPGFKYRYHGLPDNNAFWPGALLDKLRLWLPSETLTDKPYSLYNIFQPVCHPKIYNPHSPMTEQRKSWPENEGGYVQFGSQTRKRYHLH